MRRTNVGAFALVGLALVACAPCYDLSAQGTPERPGPQPSRDLPSELSRVLRDYERFWSTGQEDELATLFVEEGLIVRNGSWIRGRAAIREAYRDASGPLRLRAIEYATDGGVGYVVGAYGYGEEAQVQDRGMFVLTLRRNSSGLWLIVSDLDRSAS
jgi:hypothetical protein